MKKGIVGIICILVILASFIMTGFLLAASSAQRHSRTCSKMEVNFTDDFNFITEEDVRICLDKHYGPYNGQRLDSVNLCRIERILDSQSAVLKSEAYTTNDGTLHISISQREPILRFQNGRNGFYVDERGYIFPLQDKYTSSVTVIDGEIPLYFKSGYRGEPESEKERKWMKDVLSMTQFINESRLWSDKVVQISVVRNSDLIIVLREGKEKFIIGYPSDIQSKFSRIEKYYQYIKPVAGEDKYSTVNVKYAGQIICK